MVARTKVRLAWTLRQVPLRLRSSPGPLTIEYASHECGSKYKPALVTLPSSGSSHEQYAPLAAALKVSGAVSKVISINFFGSKGSTPWPQLARPLTLDDLADLVKAVVDDQKLEHHHVLGHSFGGAVALRYCAAHAENVESLVLFEPFYFHAVGEHRIRGARGVDAEEVREEGFASAMSFVQDWIVSGRRDFKGFGELFHRYFLQSGDDDTWANLSPQRRDALLAAMVPHSFHELGANDGARGQPAARDLAAAMKLAKMIDCDLVVSHKPGRGSIPFIRATQAALGDVGFKVSTLAEGGHLAPMTHSEVFSEHMAPLYDRPGPMR